MPSKWTHDSDRLQADGSFRLHLQNPTRRNWLWRTHLFHQIVVPLAFDLEVRRRAQLHRFDEVVSQIGIKPG